MGKRKREREEEEDRERRREKKRKREKSKYRDRDDREDRDERRERRHKEKKRRKRERRYSSSESDSETEPLRQDQGPALPPHMMAGPDVPPEVEHDQPQAKVHHGPALPPHLLASMEKKEEEPVEAKKPGLLLIVLCVDGGGVGGAFCQLTNSFPLKNQKKVVQLGLLSKTNQKN